MNTRYGPPDRVYMRAWTAYDSEILLVYSSHTGGQWHLMGGADRREDCDYMVKSGYAVWAPDPQPGYFDTKVLAVAVGPVA